MAMAGALASPASAQVAVAADPESGGLSSALTYQFPADWTPGDLLLTDPVSGAVEDVLRFSTPDHVTGDSNLVFYSVPDPVNAKADTGLPTAYLSNQVTLPESGGPGVDGVFYTPTAGQPGFLTSPAFAVEYVFVSDGSLSRLIPGVVPEPGTWAMTLLGLGALGAGLRSRRRAALAA